jgi:hypothetical protein
MTIFRNKILLAITFIPIERERERERLREKERKRKGERKRESLTHYS